MPDLRTRIEQAITEKGRGWVFSRKDLRDIASSGAVGVILTRLVKSGMIRRIGVGLYEYPQESRQLSSLLPTDLDQAAQAIARKHRWTIAPDGAMAANLLGLSTQVPAKVTYISDGPSKGFQIGTQTISFRSTSPKDLNMKSYSSRLVAQALRHMGRPNVDERTIAHLRHVVPADDRAQFLLDARYSTDWILEVAQKLAQA